MAVDFRNSEVMHPVEVPQQWENTGASEKGRMTIDQMSFQEDAREVKERESSSADADADGDRERGSDQDAEHTTAQAAIAARRRSRTQRWHPTSTPDS